MKVSIALFFSLLTGLASAQDTLTLSAAIELALKNNYAIRISKNEAEQASTLNHPGQAGIYPTIAAGVADQFSSSNIFQRFATGDEISSNNASGNVMSAFVGLDWTLFSGFRLSATKDRLEELDQRGQLALKSQTAQTVFEVTSVYSNIVRLTALEESTDELVAYNKQRLEIMVHSFESGLVPKSMLTQAEVDLNEQDQMLRRIKMELINARIDLNVLLALDPNTSFLTSRNVPPRALNTEEYRGTASMANYDLLMAKSALKETEIAVKQAESWLYPQVTLSSAINFTRSDNSAGFALVNRNYGPTAGINIAIPIYNGGIYQRQKKVATMQLENAGLVVRSVEESARGEIIQWADTYDLLMEMKQTQERNIEIAKENLTIARERFKEGQSNSLELRQAELSYIGAYTELSNLNYEIILAETRLLLLSGKL